MQKHAKKKLLKIPQSPVCKNSLRLFFKHILMHKMVVLLAVLCTIQPMVRMGLFRVLKTQWKPHKKKWFSFGLLTHFSFIYLSDEKICNMNSALRSFTDTAGRLSSHAIFSWVFCLVFRIRVQVKTASIARRVVFNGNLHCSSHCKLRHISPQMSCRLVVNWVPGVTICVW